MTSRRLSTLRRQALALEPRFLLDAAAVATAADVAKNVAPTDTAPGVEATPNHATVTITDSTDSIPDVDLFNSVHVSLDNSSQELTNLVITVDRTGASHALVIDGTEIKLQSTSAAGSTANNDYSYSVTVSGNITTITLSIDSSAANSTANVSSMIDGIAYRALDTKVESGTIHVRLASLSDSGEETAVLDIGAQVEIRNNINVAPVLSDTGVPSVAQTFTLADLGSSREIAYSSDGKYLYAANASGAIAVFAVGEHDELTFKTIHAGINGLSNIADLALSADGKQLYAITGGNIVALDIGVDGTLSNARSTATGDSVRNIALSDDGKQVYVTMQYNGMAVFNRDPATGNLTHLQNLDEGSLGGGRSRTVTSAGDYVFVASGNNLVTLHRNADGTLAKLDAGSQITGISVGTEPSLAVSANGSMAFIGDGSTIRIYALRDGALEARGTLTLNGVSALAVSQDGSRLYATSSNGSMAIYSISATGALTLTGTLTGVSGGAALALSPDGENIAVAGNGVTRLSMTQAYTVGGDPIRFAGNLSLSDVNADPLANGAGDYNGTRIVIGAGVSTGTFGFAVGNGLELSGGVIKRDGVAIATFAASGDTLTITFTASTTAATANQVLRQLTYANTDAAAGSQITLTVRGNDGALDSNAIVVVLPVNHAPQIDTGVAAGYVLDKATSETSYSVSLPADLFKDADGDTLRWSVTGLPAGLSFNADTRTLSGTTQATGSFTVTITVTDAYGATAEHTLTLDVDQIANRAPEVSVNAPDTLPLAPAGKPGYSVTLDAGMFHDPDSLYAGSTLTWSVGTLPAGLVFDAASRTLSGTPVTAGAYQITVTVTDEDGATAEHTMTLRVISEAEASNSAPALTPGADTLGYTSDGSLSGFNSYVNSLTLSHDGSTLVIAGSSGQLAGGDGTLYVYSRDTATGALTLLQSFVLPGITSVSYTDDGSLMYVATGSGTAYSIAVFHVEDNGGLTKIGTVANLTEKVLEIKAGQDRDALYVLTATTLRAYGTDADGALTLLGTYAPAAGFGTAVSLQLGEDGTVYALSGGRLTIFAASADGSLSYSGQLTRSALVLTWTDATGAATQIATLGNSNAFSGANAFVVSKTGNIYITTDNFFLTTLRYDSAAGKLSLAGTTSVSIGGQTAYGLTLSDDGKVLYLVTAAGTGISLYSVGADGLPTFSETIGTAGGMSRVVVSADGQSIYGGKHRFFSTITLSMLSAGSDSRGAYTEGATTTPASSITLSDADYDALANGAGDYHGATITIGRDVAANTGDRFGFVDGNDLSLVGSEIRYNGIKIADFTNAGGVLTIAFTAQVSTATANAVLHQVSYTHDGKDPGAMIRLKIQVQDQFASGTDSAVVALAVTQVNDAPVVVSTPANTTYSPGGAAVGLFNGTTVSTVESGQTITSLTVVVSGVANGASETLTVDGVAIALAAGQGVTAAGHAYTVTVSGGTVTVVVTSTAGLTGADAAALINGLGYANSSAAPTVGERSITLTAVRDSGGTSNGGHDTAEPDLSAKVNVQFEAPVLNTPIDSLAMAELIKLLGEDNWTNLLEGILDVANVDGKFYVLRTTTEWNSEVFEDIEVNTLFVLQRGADGTLSIVQSFGNGDVSALAGASDLRVSADGKSLYVIGNQGVVLFSRDAATGALTTLGSFGANVVADYGMIRDVLSSNGNVYVTAGDNLLVFKQDGATLTLAHTYADAGDSGLQLDGANALTLSADGRYLFVGTSGGSTLVSVFRLDANGVPAFVMAAQGKDPAASEQYYYTTSMTVSADGKSLYVVDYDNNEYRVHTLSISADGQLTALGAILPGGDVKQVIVSPDGSGVFVISADKIGVYSRGADGVPLLVSEITSYDGLDFTEIRSATLSADGTKLYLTGEFSYDAGVLVLDLKPASAHYKEGTDPVAVLPVGTLSDPQLDALNNGQGNYQGASITIARAEGAHGDDRFSFIDGGNLQLDAANGVILLNGMAVATFAQSGGELTLRFTAAISQADAQNVLRRIAYSNASSDPTRDGNAITLRTVLNDGDGHSDELLTGVDLEGVNDAPIADTTPLNPTFHAEGEAVKLFENTTIDTVEAGQNVARVIVTISPSGAQDILGADGGRIALDKDSNGPQRTATGLEYMVTLSNGVATVTIYLNASPARAAEVINSLTYRNTGSSVTGTRTISLTVQEFGSENASTQLAKEATVTLAAATGVNTPPSLGGGATVDYTERADAVQIAPGAVIADAQMDAFNGGAGNYDGSVLTIELGAGKSASDTIGFLADNGLTLENGSLKKDGVTIGSVSQANGVLVIRFSDAAGSIPTTADVQNTLRQITYANSSHAPAESVQVSVTMTDQRGLTSSVMQFEIDIAAINDAPVVGADPVLSLGDLTHVQELATISGLGTLTSSVVSADGSRVYVADGRGAIAVFSRDGQTGALTYTGVFAGVGSLTGISQLVMSVDGKSLYALRADSNAIGVFSIAADGALTHQSTLTSNYAVDAGNLNDIKGITLSQDGKNLYLVNNYNLAYFSRNAETGALTYVGAVAGDMSAEPYLWAATDMVSRGDLVFVVTHASNGSALIVYRRDGNGMLTALAHLYANDTDAAGQAVSLANLQHIAVSADGSTIFVSNSRTSSFNGWTGEYEVHENTQVIDAFRLNAATGALTHLGTLTGDKTVEGIALSADGKALFVTLADGTLNYYATANLSLVGSRSGLDGAGQIVVSADGGVIVVGNALDVLNAPPAASPVYVIDGEPVLLAPVLTLSDAELDAADNYQGASLTFTGQAGDRYAVQTGDGYTRNGDVILFNGQAIATLTQANGVATLRFTAAISRADANALLHRVTYASTDATPGARSITISLNDGQTASTGYGVDVTLALPNQAPVEGNTTYTPDAALAGRPYSVVLPESLFSDPDGDKLAWSISGLPDGLVFNAETRTISGRVTVTGQFTLVVTVTDPDGLSASRELTLDAALPPNTLPVDSGIPLAPDTVRVGVAYVYTLPAGLFTDADGDALTWQVSGLPEGLVFDPETLTIRGTASTAGSVALVISATDPSGASVSRIVTLTVAAVSAEPSPGTNPGTNPGTSPGANPDPNANPNPGTPAIFPPPDLSTQQRPVFFTGDAQAGAEEDALQQRAQQAVERAPIAPALEFGVSPRDGLTPQEPWTSSSLLDALLADSLERRDSDAVRPFTMDAPNGIRTPLAVLASPDAPGLSFAAAAFTGYWRADAAGNRHVYALPAGLIRSSSPVATLVLRMADGTELPPGVRLDAARGLIVAPGLAGAQTLALQLVARTVSGEVKVVPVTVSADRLGAWRHGNVAARDDAPAAADKPALSQQLRMSAAQDVLAQAQQFLASLDDDAAAGDSIHTNAGARPFTSINVAS
ncbi:putative Ig domain-containing protein [Achromobacter seleniivolatilans]|uniref:Ig domain-containing protein n=1 Tax=Achromobacter seleniivolatilans TaxID=3047478 RepID=A0ABY9LWX1_9BURK|nr:putative Ig domain-containing protein [Achromobacter sp. R39]WMD18985.1 putative Ig domain-containing protein [Achromobacter sp. R39]